MGHKPVIFIFIKYRKYLLARLYLHSAFKILYLCVLKMYNMAYKIKISNKKLKSIRGEKQKYCSIILTHTA